MSIEINEPVTMSKGQKVKALVEASLSPSQKERMQVFVQKDCGSLTKVTIRFRLKDEGEGGTVAGAGC